MVVPEAYTVKLPVGDEELAETLQGARGAGSDFPPTTQQIEVQEVLEERMATYQGPLDELLRADFAAFNNILRENNIPHIIARASRDHFKGGGHELDLVFPRLADSVGLVVGAPWPDAGRGANLRTDT